ncbi:unnamed protein product [Brachionus calyciflorus]|uniref:Reverse transcriptase domain-containing protein n=1 Tax=Brachionus calyciflorus TaxID=104777 RepID=A0A814S0R4_9BILA|nr:unnamed protein product [Brachionus calyciflorus]
MFVIFENYRTDLEQKKSLDEIEKRIMDYEKEVSGKNDVYSLSYDVIKQIIKNLPNGKSKGFSDTSNEMFKYGACETLIKIIKKFMEKIIQFGKIPKFFNIGIIKPIVKDDQKSANDLNNIRPITIYDTISNIFEKIILNEISKTHEDPNKQFGFKKNSSCSHAVFTVKETINFYNRKNKRVFGCAIDASKAFDKVNRMILFEKLIDKIHYQIWRSLKTYYESSMAIVQNGNEVSNLFKTTIGVKQGGPLSAKLFSVYAEDIIRELEERNIGTKIHETYTGVTMYADDILLLSPNIKELQDAINVCENFGLKNEIKFNPEK